MLIISWDKVNQGNVDEINFTNYLFTFFAIFLR